MRITQSMLIRSNLNYISNNYERYGEIQDQINSGKKITRPSQDPVIAMKGMRYRSQVVEVEQFQRNLSEAYSWMDNADASLDKTTQILQRMKELVVQASNDTYTTEDRKAAAMEVEQLEEHLVAMANTKVGDKYIFNGTNTNAKPVDLENIHKEIADVAGNAANMVITYQGKQFNYDSTSVSPNFKYTDGIKEITVNTGSGSMSINPAPISPATFNQDDVVISQLGSIPTNQQDFRIEVMKGITLPVNITPQNVYSAELFHDISNLKAALEDPSQKGGDIGEFLNKIEDHLSSVTQERAELGARYNRVELVDERLAQQEIIANQTMSENEDIDFEKAIVDLTSQESLHRAALAAGARIIQPTLMDFLR
ncbi:hypothetical protein ABE29_18740 [Cytobacillus firmus]|uniref:flagellar hook-associated protein FlgL n=1 Tax=Cytobacillus firmus TaxID=1399 RepID=UPI00077C9BD5|nr:flagellar hook-associated protein FlgL [Cytobacillus firmus]MBG9544720.1 hypothetical protein [Cytobacillus firmus]MBG9554001.1 hypothetical protein [Cytobacillus firmus]MBG9558467.1 hypothetical protein [Cytobacillus firmus]MBG9576990.1 hypothetical protein [Cytobacillus firmus]MEC1894359.1 flagellar hook-associated protein FlgL [Cytobacillus firmus]